MAKADLTAARLRDIIKYDPETGAFTWLVSIGHRCKPGQSAGHIGNVGGYLLIGIERKTYTAHRLAWLYVHGEWPKQHIDHINGVRLDNRIANLRDVPNSINCQNRHTAMPSSTHGYLGATYNKRVGVWAATITANGKTYSLGCHKSGEAAHQAYLEAKRRLHEGCTI
jgi:hypothetical protein